MTRNTMILLIFAMILAVGGAMLACDEAKDLIDEYTEASDQTACGRYCIQCGVCKDVGDGYIKMVMDYTCAFEEGGKLCELACDQGSAFIPGGNIKENITEAEASSGKKVTEMTCEEFAMAAVGVGDTPCGRYCIKCESCKGTGTGYVKDALDYTCGGYDGSGKLCEQLCERGSIPGMNIKENVEDAEESLGENITELSCEEFALTVASGVTDGPCLRFCGKCVECSPVSSGAEWCAKEGGMPCIVACEEGFKQYVETLEGFASDNTEGINTLSDLDCNDWDATLEASGLEAPEIPGL